MMHSQILFPGELLLYILASRLIVRCLDGTGRDLLFALINLAGLYVFFFNDPDDRYLATYLAYVGIAIICYRTLRLSLTKPKSFPWTAFMTPLVFLILIRYLPSSVVGGPGRPYGPFFVGISYLAFRNSYLVTEIGNGLVPRPGFFRYLGYCFFVPTIPMGPINPYSRYQRGFDGKKPNLPVRIASMRLVVGLVKYKFISVVFFQLSYPNLLLDDHYHSWIDLPVAMIFYYLFLYSNFSGFCDMAIGAAGLIGIPVSENFDAPLTARNMREFWNRWHITLSQYMRDVVFAPLSKYFVRKFGPSQANQGIALAIVVVFVLIGVWHGVGWNYFFFGVAQALGVVTAFYYTLLLKKRLGREGFKAYNENPWIRAGAVTVTFCYYAATLFFFANSVSDMKRIFAALR